MDKLKIDIDTKFSSPEFKQKVKEGKDKEMLKEKSTPQPE